MTHSDGESNDLATEMRVDLGVCIYIMYAELSQQPRVLMRDSCVPRNAAVVAAPI